MGKRGGFRGKGRKMDLREGEGESDRREDGGNRRVKESGNLEGRGVREDPRAAKGERTREGEKQKIRCSFPFVRLRRGSIRNIVGIGDEGEGDGFYCVAVSSSSSSSYSSFCGMAIDEADFWWNC